MIPSTVERVPQSTSSEVNLRIEAQIAESVRQHAEHPEAIDHHLQELNREWDIERTLEANASALGFIGVMLGAFASPWWLLLPAIVTAFLFQHAIQGWCPPVPILRRLGFRTEREIDIERNALKVLRGDYGAIGPDVRDHDTRASHALQAARL
ncbi:YgaP family membrane protein [Rhodoplanes roseus]|jgi:hypothetical protein|uniref:DUF2892 domain-containing protein n=1 Tax=Rhodoplanes roseus TaxID=29409 RepID=A0A327L9G9_9BRAD|nr:DUF2892 domain-containing protein [Rhodoplanes roseus]RAI46182.1 hypothetical protein CH341_00330 [Rhodoplanes roseus]